MRSGYNLVNLVHRRRRVPSHQCHDDTNAPKQKEVKPMSTISIRYMIDDVPAAIKFYTTHLGFVLDQDASPAFASVTRDGVRLHGNRI